MVDVGVGQQDEVNGRRVERERLVVACCCYTPTLNHAAIDQEADISRFDQEARSGDFSGCAQKTEFHRAFTRVFASGKC